MAVYKKTDRHCGAGDSPATVLRQVGTVALSLQDRAKPVRRLFEGAAAQDVHIFFKALETADGRL